MTVVSVCFCKESVSRLVEIKVKEMRNYPQKPCSRKGICLLKILTDIITDYSFSGQAPTFFEITVMKVIVMMCQI